MTDLETLKKVFEGQDKKSVKSGDYDKLTPTVAIEGANGAVLSLDNLQVGFAFTKAGKLKGIFNWK